MVGVGGTYNCGWMGLRSVPITFADGNSEARMVVRTSDGQKDVGG